MVTVTPAGSGNLRTSSADPRIAHSVGLGELLRRARENRGLSLERVARETRIPQRRLEALEHVDQNSSSVGFYQRAEIRAYAQSVGLDREVLRVAMRPFEAPNSSRDTMKGKWATRLRTYGLIAVGVVVAVVAIGRAVPQSAPSSGAESDTVSPSAPVQPALDAAPVTAVTELVVTSRPAGARVTVNGIGWGVTPLTIRHVPPGDKRIRVSKEGYTSQELVFRLDEGRRQALDIQLESAP